MEDRRRVSRRSAGLLGLCHIEGESDPAWRDCRVTDVSTLGLGITLHHFWPSQLVGRQITVEAPAGDAANIHLVGIIMNADRSSGSVIRVGIAFDGLTVLDVTQADILRALVEQNFAGPLPEPAVEISHDVGPKLNV